MTKPLNPLQKLISNVKRVVTPESRWTIGFEAADVKGNTVSPRSKKACKWCLIGALKKVSSDRDPNYRKFKRLARTTINGLNGRKYDAGQEIAAITNFNDSSDHREVIDLLDEMKRKAA